MYYTIITPLGIIISHLSEKNEVIQANFHAFEINDETSNSPHSIFSEIKEGKKNIQIPNLSTIFPLEANNDLTHEYVTDQKFWADYLYNVANLPVKLISSSLTRDIRQMTFQNLFEQRVLTEEQYFSALQKQSIEICKEQIKTLSQAKDKFIIQAIKALDDLNSTVNLIAERVREWYGIHFPELEGLVRDNAQYLRLISSIGHRNNITEEHEVLQNLSEKRRNQILKAKNSSIGADLAEEDVEPIKNLAELGNTTVSMVNKLSNYIENSMKQVCPNLNEVVGPRIGARLLSLAGGLDRLAKMPASTIQVLGAEKALFRHLKTGSVPPKHGILFQDPRIHNAPVHLRGKIARLIATKTSIAARLDYFGNNFLGEELTKEIHEKIEEIKQKYPKPSPRQMKKKTTRKHSKKSQKKSKKRDKKKKKEMTTKKKTKRQKGKFEK